MSGQLVGSLLPESPDIAGFLEDLVETVGADLPLGLARGGVLQLIALPGPYHCLLALHLREADQRQQPCLLQLRGTWGTQV